MCREEPEGVQAICPDDPLDHSAPDRGENAGSDPADIPDINWRGESTFAIAGWVVRHLPLI